jgi:hypothetical protein
MKRLFVYFALCLILAAGSSLAQEIPVPLENGWNVAFSTSLPLFKIVESSSGSRMDVLPMVGLGGGLTIYWGPEGDEENEKLIAINIPTLIVNERETDGTRMDLTVAADVGFFDNRLRAGIAYEFGDVPDRSRFIGVFSYGVSF